MTTQELANSRLLHMYSHRFTEDELLYVVNTIDDEFEEESEENDKEMTDRIIELLDEIVN